MNQQYLFFVSNYTCFVYCKKMQISRVYMHKLSGGKNKN